MTGSTQNDECNIATAYNKPTSGNNNSSTLQLLTAAVQADKMTGIRKNDADTNRVLRSARIASNIASAAVSEETVATVNAMSAIMNQPTTPLPCPSINNIIGIQHETCNKAQKFNAAVAHSGAATNDAKNNKGNGENDNHNLANNANNNDLEQPTKSQTSQCSSMSANKAATFLQPALLLKALPSNLPLLAATTAANAVSFKDCCKTQHNVDNDVAEDNDDDDDFTMKSLEHSYSEAAATTAVTNCANLEEKFSAMIATVYEHEK